MVSCNNCGKVNPAALVEVHRIRGEDGVGQSQSWCLECIQGKNQIKEYPKT